MTIISKLISSENISLQAAFAKKIKLVKQPEPKIPMIGSEISILKIVSMLFEKLYDLTPQDNEKSKKTFCIYNCIAIPSIGIEDYLKRVQTYLKCPDEMYLLCLVYIDKLIQKTGLIITGQNIHKLLLTALTLSCKFLDDDWESNDYMAKLGGIPLAELNMMELHFLKDINYELFIDHQTLVFYHKHIKDYFSHFLKISSKIKTS